ncbi:MAG: hypothetical protein M3P11_03560 [Actinomycetota bacterium]|nr:hypothetical protein [Actinomycetota bacterium]
MRRPRRSVAYLLALGITFTTFVTAIQIAGAAPVSPNPGASRNELRGVDAVSSSDVWAVGNYLNDTASAYQALIIHWNGTEWSQVTSPDPSSTENDLLGVSAISSSNAWAVGTYFTTIWNTLILHWDGATWSQVTSPNPSLNVNGLSAVTAISASNVWAVGTYYNDSTLKTDTLVLHWNGTKWSKAQSPNPSAVNALYGVSAFSSSDVWAVGSQSSSNEPGSPSYTLVLHWNGTKWSKVASPRPSSTFNVVRGVSAVDGSNAWAVGSYINDASSILDTLILRWNGARWSKATSPNPGSSDNSLSGVSALSTSDAWAVGSYYTLAGYQALILHWNGTRWSKSASPNPSPTENHLYAVDARSSSNAWAVGFYDSAGVWDTFTVRWNGTKWSQK